MKKIHFPGTGETEYQFFKHGYDGIEPQREWDTERRDNLPADEREKRDKRNLRRSQRRAKSMIYKLARANCWDWFLTMTLDPDKVDRYDYDACRDKVRNQLKKMRRHYPDMQYLLTPEQHEDGAYHFHALVYGMPDDAFTDSGETSGSGKRIYNIAKYTMGFTTATRVEDSGRAANYLSKYITKGLLEATPDRQRYWRSEGLTEPEEETFLMTEEEQQKMYYELGENLQYVNKVELEHGDYHEVIMYVHCKELTAEQREEDRQRDEDLLKAQARFQRQCGGPPDTPHGEQPPPAGDRPRHIPEVAQSEIEEHVNAKYSGDRPLRQRN